MIRIEMSFLSTDQSHEKLDIIQFLSQDVASSPSASQLLTACVLRGESCTRTALQARVASSFRIAVRKGKTVNATVSGFFFPTECHSLSGMGQLPVSCHCIVHLRSKFDALAEASLGSER